MAHISRTREFGNIYSELAEYLALGRTDINFYYKNLCSLVSMTNSLSFFVLSNPLT